MEIQLNLCATDVTKLPNPRPAAIATELPQLNFSIHLGPYGCKITYNANSVTVTYEQLLDLAGKVATTTRVDWERPANDEIETTFRPIERITNCIDSTPSYQLFLSGLHIAEVIGMLSLTDVPIESVPASYRYNLLGNTPWPSGKKGRLFFVREGDVADGEVQHQLMANGKLFSVNMVTIDEAGMHQLDEKLFVPYVTPIGFNVKVNEITKDAWKRISDFVRQNGGGVVQ